MLRSRAGPHEVTRERRDDGAGDEYDDEGTSELPTSALLNEEEVERDGGDYVSDKVAQEMRGVRVDVCGRIEPVEGQVLVV